MMMTMIQQYVVTDHGVSDNKDGNV